LPSVINIQLLPPPTKSKPTPQYQAQPKRANATNSAVNKNNTKVVTSTNNNSPSYSNYANGYDLTGRNIFTARISNAMEQKLKIIGEDGKAILKSTTIMEMGLVHFFSNNSAINVNY